MHDVEQPGGGDAIRIAPACVEILSDSAAENLPRRYLALVAGIAGRLLAADHDEGLVGDLFALIRHELQLDVFFNYRFENDRLLLEAHGGLTAGQAEASASLAIGQAVCGSVARDRVPVHAIGVQASADPRYDLIRSIGIDSYACTPLMRGSELIGTLSFGRRWSDRFSDDELSFLHTVCHYIGLAKHRLRIEQQLREGVDYRERLLGELNHRVRNALQLAIGLVTLDVGDAEPVAREALRRAGDRLQALAAAHRPLYATTRPDRIEVLTLLRGIAEQTATRPISLVGDVEVDLPVERAVALALLAHELLARDPSAAVVASDAQAPQITLRYDPAGNDPLRLEFSGVMDRSNLLNDGASRMIDALVRQLRATIVSGGSCGGLVVTIPDVSRA